MWLEDAQKRAYEKNISLDSSITLDAIYQVKVAMEKEKNAITPELKKRIADFRAFIKSDKHWRDDAQKRADEKNISLDSSITLDAIYQVKLAMENERKNSK